MRIDIISAVPGIVTGALDESIIKRAREKGKVEIVTHNLRDYADGKYRQVDDKPFGGGGGMVLKPEPFFKCIEILLAEREYDNIIHLTPQGVLFDQKTANMLSLNGNLMMLCGHYKGIDQRVIDTFATMEISIGDYVLTGGEIAALVVIDSVVRLLPEVLGNSESLLSDSFQFEGVFDAPQFTRPADFRGMQVPDILLKGNHKEINEWRAEQGKQKFSNIKKTRKKKK